jgi:hypothetical protein
MKCLRVLFMLLITVFPVAEAGAGDSPPAAGRYTVSATLVPAVASTDGRYRVDAVLRVASAVQSPDGRYRIKAAAATCDPADDRVFANGFETP